MMLLILEFLQGLFTVIQFFVVEQIQKSFSTSSD